MKYFLDTEFIEGIQEPKWLILKSRLGHWMIGTPKPTIDLISIGIVAEDSREYYAISKDFNLKEAWNRHQWNHELGAEPEKVYWLRDNVLKPIWIDLFLNYEAEFTFLKGKAYDRFEKELKSGLHDKFFTFKSMSALLKRYGKSNLQIAKEIQSFTTHVKFVEDPNGKFNIGTDMSDAITKGDLKWDDREFYAYYADYDWVAFCWLFGKMLDLPKEFPMYCRDLKQMIDDHVDKINSEIKDSRAPRVTVESVKRNNPYFPKQENEHSALDDARWNKRFYEFFNFSKLYYYRIDTGRRSGKTTLLVDEAIQEVFKNPEGIYMPTDFDVKIEGMHRNAKQFVDVDARKGNRAQRFFIERLRDRLKYEHNINLFEIKNGKGYLQIKLKQQS